MKTNNLHEMENTNNMEKTEDIIEVVGLEKTEGVIEAVGVELPTQFEDLLYESEKALETSTTYRVVREAGYFTHNNGMAHITNRCDDRIYAGRWEKPNGNQIIKFCIKDNNNNYSAPIILRQAEFIMAMQYEFTVTKDMSNILKKVVEKFITNFTLDYLDRIPFSCQVDPIEVLKAIADSIDKLPYHNYSDNMGNIEALYYEFIDLCSDYYSGAMNEGIYNHRAYYAFTEMHIEHISQQLEIKPKDLLKIFKENNLLYLPPSAKRGFKTKVKMGTEYEYCYCIKKLEILEHNDQSYNNSDNTDLE